MTTRSFGNMNVDVNPEGFLTNPADWTMPLADAIAHEEGIPSLGLTHWKVIDFCRAHSTGAGNSPTLRQITAGTGVGTKEMFALFPKGPAKKVARISGLGKPEGCV